MNGRLKSWHIDLIYVVIFLFMAWFYGLFDSMDQGPYSRHQWRQSDCLSITQNYAQDGLPFLAPEIHWQGEQQTGKTISEFPLIYYTVGKIWSSTGKAYWIFRSINFFIFGLGLFYLRKLSKKILKDNFWSIFVPLFVFVSPVLVYYSNNFLMNVNALSFAIIGAYHFYVYRVEKSYKKLLFSAALFTLAGLFKLTSLLLFFSFGAITLYELIIRERALKTRWKELLPFAGTLIIIFFWYRYVNSYNAANLSQIFLQGTLPIWEQAPDARLYNWNLIRKELVPAVYPWGGWLFILAVIAVILLRVRKINRYFLALFALIFMGIVVYVLLFYQALNEHDYYLINLTIIVPIGLLTALRYLSKHHQKWFSGLLPKGLATLVLMVLTYNAAVQTRIKYSVGDKWVTQSPFIDDEQLKYWEWYHWNYERTYRGLEDLEPQLEKWGIGRNKKVLSIPDGSINITLFLMNRKGYSDFWMMSNPKNHALVGKDRVKKTIEWGAEYLVVNDTTALANHPAKSFIEDTIGMHRNVMVYRLRTGKNP